MNIQDSASLYGLLGTALTGILALLVLVINQVFEMKKAALARQFAHLDAISKDKALDGIHNLVNSQLTAALHEISDLKKLVAAMIKATNGDMLKMEAQLAIEKKNHESKSEPEPVQPESLEAAAPEAIPVVEEAEVKKVKKRK